MTLNGLIFNVCTALYFVVGGAVEERRMKRAYGEVYSSYQRDVSWLFSSPRRR
jgi:protein-S-isoprenylcysteine O-methyltransferase Ste14